MNAVIIVPIYKDNLDQFERISLQQLKKILGKYQICAVIPQRLNGSPILKFADYTESFPNEFFESTKTYSRLLMSSLFYERFADYKYMLIYQTDAFVFSDKLDCFCSLDYDYIGAPLSLWGNFYWCSLYTGIYDGYRYFRPRVGNGGFSLRKISSILRILKHKNEILNTHPLRDLLYDQEDMFFSFAGTLNNGLKIPNMKIARQFSCESNMRHYWHSLKDCLPFGCHAWKQLNYEMWKPFIENYGYKLPQYCQNEGGEVVYRKNALRYYLIFRLINSISPNIKLRQIILQLISKDNCILWGYGKDGVILFNLFQRAQINIDRIFDTSSVYSSNEAGVPITTPDIDYLQFGKKIVLIGTSKYEDEIGDKLTKANLVENKNFFKFSHIIDYILFKYYGFK